MQSHQQQEQHEGYQSKTPTIVMGNQEFDKNMIMERPESASHASNATPQKKGVIILSKQLIRLPIKQKVSTD